MEKDSGRAERQNRKLFEGVSPSFCDLVEQFMNPKIAHSGEQNGSFLNVPLNNLQVALQGFGKGL